MKKLTSILLIILLLLSLLTFSSCTKTASSEISCEEIIKAYKDAGYSVLYHGHENDESYNDLGKYCCFEIRDPDNEDNYLQVDRYFSEEDAEAAE